MVMACAMRVSFWLTGEKSALATFQKVESPWEKGVKGLGKGLAMIYSGKGGARHFSKPKVDEGILLKIFANHSPLISDFGAYESISRNQACHPQGLIHVLGLVSALVAVEKKL